MTQKKDAFIFDAVRTPRAKRKGKYSQIHPVDLATYPLNALLERQKVKAENIEDLVLGCVTQTAEQGWCVGRAAALASGWPFKVPATTVNRLCGSGQQALNFVSMGVAAGYYNLAIAGGLEHMTRVPMFSDVAGEDSKFLKHYHPDLVQQGLAAELLAEKYRITRPEIDTYACNSQKRAKLAQNEARFNKSLIPVPYKDDQGQEQKLIVDDTVRGETSVEGLSQLKTVFKEGGVITAGNASAIVDGAAAILIGSEEAAKNFKLKPRARVLEFVSIGSDPRIMLDGPVEASREVLRRAGLQVTDIDIWEINEAFAPVPLLVIKELGLDPAKVNINGGGISLGHPLGATGAMLMGTALDELERTNKKYALITMCIGLGMGIATIIERV